MRTYRVSALASALVRMWRGWSVIVPVAIVNALAQAALVAWELTLDRGWLLLLSALLSAVVFVLAYGLVAATALQVPDGRVHWPETWTRLRTHLARYATWSLVVFVLVVLGLLVNGIVALLIVGATAFVPLAALDDRGSPPAVALRTIGRRFWRWLLTLAMTTVGLAIGSLLSGVTAFFLRGALAAAVVWIVGGLVVAWLATAWALIYRSAWGEPRQSLTSESDSAPDLEPA